ncbi:MAG TPA: IS5 family transposase [Hyphomicrobium sp.]|jgi:IS5 family transposase
MHRSSGQGSLAEAWLDPGLGRNQRLDAIAGLIDWSAVERLVASIHAAPEGRKAYSPLVMVKALLLQQWYGLSDPRLEEALSDTLSFRRFVGLGLDEGTPDHSTVSRFRTVLREKKLDAALLAEIERQLDGRGLILKRGTLMDATVVEAQARKVSWQEGAGSQGAVDPDANWTRKGGKSSYGYKAHLGVDQGSGLIRRVILTPAKTYESEVADGLVCGDERAVYGDKAYEHKGRRARLKAVGIKDRIMHRSHKNQTGLPPWQARRNRLIAPIRAAVERVFGTLKRCYGYTRVRYFSLAANATQLRLLAIAYNLRRAQAILN